MIYNMDWVDNCACRGKTELFFAPARGTENTNQRRVREKIAISICRSCPVIAECRDHARRKGEQGIWGGETDEDRWNAGFMRNNATMVRLVHAREYRSRIDAEKRAALRAETQ